MATIDFDTILTILALLGTMILGWVAGNSQYQRMKERLQKFTELIDEINAAIYDDKVTEEEFRKVWEKAKGFYESLKN
mgnify:CR=1 FL=1